MKFLELFRSNITVIKEVKKCKCKKKYITAEDIKEKQKIIFAHKFDLS